MSVTSPHQRYPGDVCSPGRILALYRDQACTQPDTKHSLAPRDRAVVISASKPGDPPLYLVLTEFALGWVNEHFLYCDDSFVPPAPEEPEAP